MKVKELTEKLKELPQDAPVILCDSERMAYEASGDPSNEGLYHEFEVELDKEMFFGESEEPVETVVLSFETDYVQKVEEYFQDLVELREKISF